jgi:hypothetical protein
MREHIFFWGAGSSSNGGSIAGGEPEAGSSPGTALTAAAAAGGLGGSPAAAGAGSSGGRSGSSSSNGGQWLVGQAVKPPQQLTVESVIATPAKLYVRHTLPLGQAKEALSARASAAAVVVDDNFTPMGIVYLEDIEAELVKQQLLNQPDANFDRPVQ